jgi:hypothetical protein
MIKNKYEGLILTTSTKSVLVGDEKRLMELINGDKPITENDKILVKQINEIKKKNRIIEIPSNF